MLLDLCSVSCKVAFREDAIQVRFMLAAPPSTPARDSYYAVLPQRFDVV